MNEDVFRVMGRLKPDETVTKYKEYEGDSKVEPVEQVVGKKTDSSTDNPVRDPKENALPPHPFLGNKIDIRAKDQEEKSEHPFLGRNIDVRG